MCPWQQKRENKSTLRCSLITQDTTSRELLQNDVSCIHLLKSISSNTLKFQTFTLNLHSGFAQIQPTFLPVRSREPPRDWWREIWRVSSIPASSADPSFLHVAHAAAFSRLHNRFTLAPKIPYLAPKYPTYTDGISSATKKSLAKWETWELAGQIRFGVREGRFGQMTWEIWSAFLMVAFCCLRYVSGIV